MNVDMSFEVEGNRMVSIQNISERVGLTSS